MRALGVLMICTATVAHTAQPRRALRWPAGAVVHVWVDARSAPPGAGALVDRALATWNAAAAGRIVMRSEGSREPGDIRVRFAAADGIYGETSPRIDRATGFIASADVMIAAEIAGEPMQQRIVIYLTALHELGHALGLPHTDAFDDIMYRFRRPEDGAKYFGAYRRQLRSIEDIGSQRATGLSSADIAALQMLYDR